MCKARLRREQFMDTRCSGPCSSGGEENYFLREEESRTGSGPPRPPAVSRAPSQGEPGAGLAPSGRLCSRTGLGGAAR